MLTRRWVRAQSNKFAVCGHNRKLTTTNTNWYKLIFVDQSQIELFKLLFFLIEEEQAHTVILFHMFRKSLLVLLITG